MILLFEQIENSFYYVLQAYLDLLSPNLPYVYLKQKIDGHSKAI